MNNKTILYSVLAVLVAGIIGVSAWIFVSQQNDTEQAAPQETDNTSQVAETNETQDEGFAEVEGDVSYDGQAGRTALELLEEEAEVEMQGEGEMAFVTSIDGVAAGENQFWAFYVNGESAPVGAGSYVTEEGDRIAWRLESF